MWWNGDWNGWAWLAMSASMLTFWGLVLWGVLTVVRNSNNAAAGRSASGESVAGAAHDPEQILRERFARGEIDDAEYEHRREVLRR